MKWLRALQGPSLTAAFAVAMGLLLLPDEVKRLPFVVLQEGLLSFVFFRVDESDVSFIAPDENGRFSVEKENSKPTKKSKYICCLATKGSHTTRLAALQTLVRTGSYST
ncbi:MAG: hypothetical protein GY822_24480 [Deltaproteobacteria bacterium]|nr:hypothetical protein [Deltaproteobacteria bacterium]